MPFQRAPQRTYGRPMITGTSFMEDLLLELLPAFGVRDCVCCVKSALT